MIKVRVFVSFKPSVFDPSSSVIQNTMQKMGFTSVAEIKENKFYDIVFDENDPEIVKTKLKDICEKILINPNIEIYRYEMEIQNTM